MGFLNDLGEIADYAESIGSGGASDWAIAQTVASQLPGRVDGPADAYPY